MADVFFFFFLICMDSIQSCSSAEVSRAAPASAARRPHGVWTVLEPLDIAMDRPCSLHSALSAKKNGTDHEKINSNAASWKGKRKKKEKALSVALKSSLLDAEGMVVARFAGLPWVLCCHAGSIHAAVWLEVFIRISKRLKWDRKRWLFCFVFFPPLGSSARLRVNVSHWWWWRLGVSVTGCKESFF